MKHLPAHYFLESWYESLKPKILSSVETSSIQRLTDISYPSLFGLLFFFLKDSDSNNRPDVCFLLLMAGYVLEVSLVIVKVIAVPRLIHLATVS